MVSCSFDLDHYREILQAVAAGGYRFALRLISGKESAWPFMVRGMAESWRSES